MPRHTHPRPRAKHSREHIRHHRERIIERRWQEIIDRYQDGWSRPYKAEEVYAYAKMDRMFKWEWGMADGTVLKMPDMWGFRKMETPRSIFVHTWPFDQPKGLMANEQVHIGCHKGKKRCSVCAWNTDSRARRNAKLSVSHPTRE